MTENVAIENDCGAGLAKAQDTAAELFQVAALMLGSEADALSLVEQTFSEVEIDPCAEQEVATDLVRRQVVGAAVARMKQTDPQAFVAPAFDATYASCIEGDDLDAAGITSAQLSELVNGTGRDEMRAWLERLPLAQRAIFVQRAVLGWDNGETAESLKLDTGSGWQPQQVSDAFRMALCSLATSLVHSATAHKATA